MTRVIKVGGNELDDAAFMEYVWRIGDGLASVFGSLVLFLLAYLFLVTLMLLVLRRRDAQ